MDLAPFLAGCLTVAVAALLVIMSPGPNMTLTLRNSLARSRKAGVNTALGDTVRVACCLMGVAVVISQSILLFNVIKWAGAAYLIYIGIKSSCAGRRDPEETTDREYPTPESVSLFAAIRSGFLTSLLNPKVTLFSGPVRRRFDAIAHWIERATGAVLGIRFALTSSST